MTTSEAVKFLGRNKWKPKITMGYICKLIKQDKIAATRDGHGYYEITEQALRDFEKIRQSPGRPAGRKNQ